MPITGDGSFFPLESLGGNKAYATQGVTSQLEPLQSSGGQYEHSTMVATLPMLTSATSGFRTGGAISATRALPALTGQSFMGSRAAGELPALAGAATATFPLSFAGAGVLPALTASATGWFGRGFSQAAVLPRLTGYTRTGHSARRELPSLAGAAQMTRLESGYSGAVLPALRGSGTYVLYSTPMFGAGELPMLVPGPYAAQRAALPALSGASLVLLDNAAFEAWVMNVRNKGVTRYTNFPFTQLVRWGKRTFAVGNGDLYELGGDLDDADPIQWSFETGLNDLGSPGVKHVPYLYIDGIIDGEVQITLIDDRNREFMYEYDTQQRGAVHQPHRRKLGNGIRTRNVAFRLGSDSGAYAEIDSLEPEATVTQRSI
jgi:hypothetical protein